MTIRLRSQRRYMPPAPLGGRNQAPEGVRRNNRIQDRRRLHSALLFLGPSLLVLIAFVFVPMLMALRLSFTDSNGFASPNWVGLGNYSQIFSDPSTLQSMRNTVIYAALFTPTAVLLAWTLALALNSRSLLFRGFFRSALFLPFIVSMAVAAFAWSFLLDPQIGLLSYWLREVSIDLGNPLQDPKLAMPTVVFIAVWKNFGFYTVVFLAGLQDVPTTLYEAAKVDGAGAWRRMINVTVPLMSNTFGFILVFALIAALQAFDQIYVLTSGGPYGATQTVVYEIYERGFQQLQLGLASALSYVLLVVTLIISVGQLKFFGKREREIN